MSMPNIDRMMRAALSSRHLSRSTHLMITKVSGMKSLGVGITRKGIGDLAAMHAEVWESML